jgi:hypothetical protein
MTLPKNKIMERSGKKHRRVKKPVYPLNLGDWIPQKDVRKLIWNKLTRLDKLMVWAAHGVNKYMQICPHIVFLDCIEFGYLDLLLWHISEEAASILIVRCSNHLHMIKWVIQNMPNNFDSVIVSERTADDGHLEILQYLHDNKFEIHSDICSIAAASGHLDVLKWGYENKYELDFIKCLCKTKNDSEVNEWLVSLLVPDVDTMVRLLPPDDPDFK